MPGILSKIDAYPKVMSSISQNGGESRQKSVNKEWLIIHTLLMTKTTFLHFPSIQSLHFQGQISRAKIAAHMKDHCWIGLDHFKMIRPDFSKVMLSFQLLWTRVSHRTSASQ